MGEGTSHRDSGSKTLGGRSRSWPSTTCTHSPASTPLARREMSIQLALLPRQSALVPWVIRDVAIAPRPAVKLTMALFMHHVAMLPKCRATAYRSPSHIEVAGLRNRPALWRDVSSDVAVRLMEWRLSPQVRGSATWSPDWPGSRRAVVDNLTRCARDWTPGCVEGKNVISDFRPVERCDHFSALTADMVRVVLLETRPNNYDFVAVHCPGQAFRTTRVPDACVPRKWPTKSNSNPRTFPCPLTAPSRETCPVTEPPLITPLLTEAVSDHAGRQLVVASPTHVPSADPERTSDLGSPEVRFVA
jgi:hypothetical protein